MTSTNPTLDTRLQGLQVSVHTFRHPISTPVRTSFGVMHDRPAVLVRVDDASGAHGWGEVWCNFPACGAEHRARLVDTVMAPLLAATPFASPRAAFERLTAATAVLALQTGEPGPIAQAIAGLDLALWDLVARRAGLPLWRVLGGASDTIGVYASGINPDAPHDMVTRQRAAGHRAFKLKVGFVAARDIENLHRVREAAGPYASVMVDANQAWDLTTAHDMIGQMAQFGLGWIEEPLRADRPWTEWQALRDRLSGLPTAPGSATTCLAAGENVAGEDAFDTLLAAGAVGVVQPDVAKWGGLSACLPVAQRIRAAGQRFCPHYLGGGIGLLHSAHLLAAVGGDGMLEIDANENPLRTLLAGRVGEVREGRVRLGEAPGIGVEPDLVELGARCGAAMGRQCLSD